MDRKNDNISGIVYEKQPCVSVRDKSDKASPPEEIIHLTRGNDQIVRKVIDLKAIASFL